MTDCRTEKDSLGEVKVPATAYYGAQTQRAVDNFPVSGHKPAFGFIWAGAAIKRAAAIVHRDLKLIGEKEVEAIITAPVGGVASSRSRCRAASTHNARQVMQRSPASPRSRTATTSGRRWA